MSCALLFLTYTNPNKHLNKLIKTSNTYIHPKYPNRLKSKYKKYIIKNLIDPTNWCAFSIVEATLNLLETAINNFSNKWFILLSEDSYPLYNSNDIENILKDDLSLFNLKSISHNYYKTSQWWILNLTDAKTIINTRYKYIDKFKHKNTMGCADELYFLSVLNWENQSYKYKQAQPIYDKWLIDTIQKSPAYINHLLKYDYDEINKNNSLFVRKITKTFNINKYNNYIKLYIIYI